MAAESFRSSGRNGAVGASIKHLLSRFKINFTFQATARNFLQRDTEHHYLTFRASTRASVTTNSMPLPTSTSASEKPSNSSTSDTNQDLRSNLSQASSIAADQAGNSAGANAGSSAAQHTKSEVEKAADKLYEERIEDEYAKREGGA